MTHNHRWITEVEVRPCAGQPRWEYARTVTTCAGCGAVARGGWHRRLRVQKVRPASLVKRNAVHV